MAFTSCIALQHITSQQQALLMTAAVPPAAAASADGEALLAVVPANLIETGYHPGQNDYKIIP